MDSTHPDAKKWKKIKTISDPAWEGKMVRSAAAWLATPGMRHAAGAGSAAGPCLLLWSCLHAWRSAVSAAPAGPFAVMTSSKLRHGLTLPLAALPPAPPCLPAPAPQYPNPFHMGFSHDSKKGFFVVLRPAPSKAAIMVRKSRRSQQLLASGPCPPCPGLPTFVILPG